MSASKDKLLRKQQIEAGTDKRSLAAAKEQAQRRKSNIIYTVVGVLLVVFFAFILIYNSTWPSRHFTAVEINGEKYSVAQLNYYYSNSYMNFYSNYYYYLSMGMFFDTSTSLKDQQYDEDMTWREYFLDTAVNDMTQIQMLVAEADAAGFTLDEEHQDAYEAELESIRTSWADLGYASYKQYLNMAFGTGVDDALVAQELYRTYIASAYSESIYNSFEYSSSDLTAYYEEHADELDIIDYAYYAVTDETVDAQAMAEAIDGTDVDEFTAYLEENVGEDAAPVSQSLAGTAISSTYSEWLLDGARTPGDTTAIELDEDTTYVVMYLDRDNNDYPTVGFRHILVSAVDEDGDGEYSQEEQDVALAGAEAVYTDWQNGEATEDSFALLATLISEDSGSSANGGLYEDVYKGEMVAPINDWLFEDGREPGDTTVVSYSGSGYTGSHVVYYTGAADMTYAEAQADSALRNEDYTAWMDESLAGYQSTTSHLGMCGKNH